VENQIYLQHFVKLLTGFREIVKEMHVKNPVAGRVWAVAASRPLEIVIPPRAGHFSTLRLLASLQRRNLRFALKQSSLRALKLQGQGRKMSNARVRNPISKLRKGLASSLTGRAR
jgi:hypothetical protein